MSATETPFTPLLQPESFPNITKTSPAALDAEMTYSLTLDEKGISRTRSASPTNDDMSYHGRDRSNTNGYADNNQNSGDYHPNDSQNGGLFNSIDPWISGNSGGYNGQTIGFSPSNNGSISSGNGYAQTPSTSYDPSAPSLLNNSQRYRSNSTMHSVGESIPLSLVNPGPVWPSEHQLSTAYAYGIRNEDGSFTRLIRADDLNRFIGYPIASSQNYSEGLIIVPPTRVPSPNSRLGQEQFVSRMVTNQLPSNQARRPSMGDGRDAMQMQIDNIVASNNPRSPPRREKIYCDKWIHEGVCAFTQLGCKYKHVMPTDKLTQVSLGLNHGFPSWFRRAHRDVCDGAPGAPTLRAPSNSPENPGSRARLEGDWRGGSKTGRGTNTKTRSMTNQTAHNGASLSRSYGPIGPPRGQSSQSHNSFNALNNEYDNNDEGDENDDEEDRLTYRGRGNIHR